jgi:hypothetical protein
MVGMVNRATADDFGYSWGTHHAWLETGSLIEVIKAAGEMVRDTYHIYQGTWSSVFLFTLQPEVFSNKAYPLVTFASLLLTIALNSLLLHYLLVKIVKFPFPRFMFINALFLLINIHFVDSYRSAFFWQIGVVHYQIPYLFCLMIIILVLRYTKTYKKHTLALICVIATFLGGSNYQAVLFSLSIMMIAILVMQVAYREKRVYWLLLPMILELSGLIISMKSPGNSIRGGPDFGFTLERFGEAIFISLKLAFRDIGAYIIEKPLMIVLLLFMMIAIFFTFLKITEQRLQYPLPGLVFIVTFLIFAAMQTPQIFAGVSIYARTAVVHMSQGLTPEFPDGGLGTSGGVWNFSLYVFTLMVLVNGVYFIGWLFTKYGNKIKSISSLLWLKGMISFNVLVLAVTLMLLLSPTQEIGINRTTFNVCYSYLVSGRAETYKNHMRLQTAILLNAQGIDVVVPETDSWQGPLYNSVLTGDPNAFTNRVTSLYYKTESIIAINRFTWNELYGHMWDEYIIE